MKLHLYSLYNTEQRYFLMCFESYFTQVEKTSVFHIKCILMHSTVVKDRTLELDCLSSNSSFVINQLGELRHCFSFSVLVSSSIKRG